MNLLSYLIFVFLLFKSCESAGLIEVFRWKQIDFYNHTETSNTDELFPKPTSDIIFPDDQRRRYSKGNISIGTDTFRKNGKPDPFSYDGYNNIPMGATHFNGRLFITIPRRRMGVPSTINYINLRENESSPKLNSYIISTLNFRKTTMLRNLLFITSVYRTKADSCKRLWFVDTGILEYPNNHRQVQRPSIWIVNLDTDELIRRIEIPSFIAETGQGLASISVDISSCEKSFAYVPDLVNNQLLIYSFEGDKIWRFEHNYFYFDPLAGDLNIGGQQFSWRDGIFSVTVGSLQNGERPIYFHAMASNNEFVVSNKVLQNETNSLRSYHGSDFRHLGSRGVSRQSTKHEFDPISGTIFYAEIHRNGVGCWQTSKPFSPDSHGTIAQDPQLMIYPSDLTIDENNFIWVLTNSLPIFIYSELNLNNFNFRVWKQHTKVAVKSTVCE